MPRQTPERPVDIEAEFPDLYRLRREAVRLHPRRGLTSENCSSVGGPMMWPEEEAWPKCEIAHKKSSGHLLRGVREKRRIRERIRKQRDGEEITAEERDILAAFKPGRHAPWISNTDPIPMLPVAQLFARDVPGLRAPKGMDLLQVFWCPFEKHGEKHELNVHLRWRNSAEVGNILSPQPEPEVVGGPELVPSPCVLHPEKVIEHPYLDLLEDRLKSQIMEWEGPEEEDNPQYIYALSIAPGWKVGGHAAWPLTGPESIVCDCGAQMNPLLTITDREWGSSTLSWVPGEDRPGMHEPGSNIPTAVYVGRGQLIIFACSENLSHPHRIVSQ